MQNFNRATTLNSLCLVVLIWVIFVSALSTSAKEFQPMSVGEHTVKLNDMKLWYKVSGSGPVCLMPTPAWGPSSDLYFRTLQSMEKYFTIVYIDSRGTGRSGRAKTLQEYTWGHLVDDLEALRVHLKQDTVWLIGHSGGGVQVLHYACRHPNRVGGLVLLNTSAVWDSSRETEVRKRMTRRKGESWYDDALKAWQSNPRTDKDIKKWIKAIDPFYWSDPTKAEQFKHDFAAESISVTAFAATEESKRRSWDLRNSLKKVTAPALIIVGDDDFISSPQSATILHLSLKNSKLLLLEECGHFPWLEQPEVFSARVPEFLEATGLSDNNAFESSHTLETQNQTSIETRNIQNERNGQQSRLTYKHEIKQLLPP